jgi:hypothetical protein
MSHLRPCIERNFCQSDSKYPEGQDFVTISGSLMRMPLLIWYDVDYGRLELCILNE